MREQPQRGIPLRRCQSPLGGNFTYPLTPLIRNDRSPSPAEGSDPQAGLHPGIPLPLTGGTYRILVGLVELEGLPSSQLLPKLGQ